MVSRALKQEGISYIVGAELPCVIVNMVRGGPGLGSIQPAQSDYSQEMCIRDSMSTAELDVYAEQLIRKHKAIPSFLDYQGYPASI